MSFKNTYLNLTVTKKLMKQMNEYAFINNVLLNSYFYFILNYVIMLILSFLFIRFFIRTCCSQLIFTFIYLYILFIYGFIIIFLLINYF